jgi:hypothetical protein
MKRNDCRHGRRTLGDPNSMDDIQAEVARFDTLRTLINKTVLARVCYGGLYVDSRPVRLVADELRNEGLAEEPAE